MNTVLELAALIIKRFEGLRLTAYKDSGGVLTIGYGHTLGVKSGDVITLAKAEEFFQADCTPLMTAVANLPIIEAAAFVDFGFNCGLGALQRVLAGKADLLAFIHDSKGNLLSGLVDRRQFEDCLIRASRVQNAQATPPRL